MELLKAVETGSVAVILTVIGILIVRYFLKDQNGRRETFKAFAEKSELNLAEKNDKIDKLRLEHIDKMNELNELNTRGMKEIRDFYELSIKEIRDNHDISIQKLIENHDLKIDRILKENDEKIKSIIRSHDDKIDEKDRELNECRTNFQNLVVADAEIKTRLADSMEGMKQTMIQIITKQ